MRFTTIHLISVAVHRSIENLVNVYSFSLSYSVLQIIILFIYWYYVFILTLITIGTTLKRLLYEFNSDCILAKNFKIIIIVHTYRSQG